ncbi:MAG: hypothetical protein NT147_09725 [Candidatus Aminicenantes bacterium]|nr:hypothetical protein [Candidatus Aminicenantes bacterium]
MIRTVVSDLGRVVLWFDNAIFLRKLAERAGKPFEEVKAAVHGDLELPFPMRLSSRCTTTSSR